MEEIWQKRETANGTIYYSEKLNKWVGQFVAGRKDDGKLNRKSVYGNTRKEVKEKMIKAQAEVQNNTYIEKQDITVGELAKEIVEDKKNSNQVSTTTHTRDLYTLSYIENGNISHMPIQKVTAKDIKNFMNTTTCYANSTIEKIYQLLGQTFRRAIERNYIIKNPMLFEEVKKPKSSKKDKEVISLSIEEQKRLIFALNENNSKYKNIILLMLFTGMRVGEVLALSIDDIDDNYIYINRTLTRTLKDAFTIGTTTKTQNSKRSITLNSTIKKILNDCTFVDNKYKLLFWDEKNEDIIKPYEINSYIRRLNEKYQITKTLHNHMLRHTFATRCIESGMSVKVLQKKLGHKKIETTLNTYASVLEKFELSEDDKLDKYLKENKIGLH